ncbi:methyltransferase domain-containing protein [Crateriforma conspicua]|uniref:Malonyl-[acyl-carrier protein] O-methyltransferase n=1 Tax=Crateriforma conspicua TaxID=2527996 RepID=A0A5C6FL42_9PLAN|nr:methyltransferase domain-containing protein [Crateriforma conspicua]TWU62737.1 Malonyl-[acyl-carrier protein] O-methyltransferase [Crateriforma conspicua]
MRLTAIQTDDVGQRFSSAATTYDRHADVQERVAADLMRWVGRTPLGQESSPDRILEIGCGTGRLTVRLAGRFATSQLTAIDLSAAMVNVARQKLPPDHSAALIPSDLRDFDAPPFDLVTSASAIHWILPIDNAFAAADRLTIPGGRVVMAWMIEGTLGELHNARLRMVPEKPPQSALPAWPQCLDAIERTGWTIHRADQRTYPTRHRSAMHLLRAIHDQGLTGGPFSRAQTPLSRGELAAVMRDYQQRHGHDDDTVSASYVVGFVDATKPA